MKKLFQLFILFSTLSFSQDQYFINSVLIDSSVNGYGLWDARSNPINALEDGSIHMIYRKWMGLTESSGFLGYANIGTSPGIIYSSPINENLPNGALMSAARYPSSLTASDGTVFAIWTETTALTDQSGGPGNGGRLFINYDNDTWFSDYPNDSMFDLNNDCLTELPCSPVNDLWIPESYLVETNATYEIHTMVQTWQNYDHYYIKSIINKSDGQLLNEDPFLLPNVSGNSNRTFSMNESGKSTIVESNGSGYSYYLFDDPESIVNDSPLAYELTGQLLMDLVSEYTGIDDINNIDDNSSNEFLINMDKYGGLHLFVYMSAYNQASGGLAGFCHLANATPDDINAWELKPICLESSDSNYNCEISTDFTFSFNYSNNEINGIYFIVQNDGDLYLYEKGFTDDEWLDGINMTNTPGKFEWGVHAVRNLNTNRTPFIYSIVDSTVETIIPAYNQADYKQNVYLGILNDSGVSSGRIVINEIMQNPSAVSDSDGEWFEIYNDSQDTVDLTDWIVQDAGSDAFVISSGMLYPQQYFLFVANGNQDENGGISNYNYIYDRGEFNLGNSSDEIILTTPLGGVVDRVVYGDESNFPDPSGKSMELLYYRYDNMNGDNWVESNNQLESGDYGTPGQENSFIAPIIDVVEIIHHQENLIVNPIDWNNPGTSDCLIDDSLQPNECDTAFFSVIISNTGSGELIFNSHKLEDVYNPLDYISRWELHNELPISISPGSSDTLSVSFIPWKEIDDFSPWIGSRQNTLYLKNNNNDEYDTEINFSTIIKLNGAGYALEIDESQHSFWEDISSNPTLVIASQYGNSVGLKLVSYGSESIEVDEVYIDSDFFTIDAGDGSLEFGDYIEIYLEFNPPSDGVFIDTVSIESSADMYFPALFNAQSTAPNQQFIVKGTTDTLSLKIEGTETIPHEFNLHQNMPNPFNPITSLRYDLPEDGLVKITVYDMMGRVVKTLVNSSQTAGLKSVQWNSTNDRNEPVSAGLYLYTIQVGEFRQTKKMVLLK